MKKLKKIKLLKNCSLLSDNEMKYMEEELEDVVKLPGRTEPGVILVLV
ncbi:MAG: hypothetical protein LUH15_06380 [Tannerellaceae bacterium]|nr:hypothetical protein [Tannerellaceae bacterium]